MKRNHKAWLAAGLLAGAAALTGCSATTAPTATKAPDAVEKQTVQPGDPDATISPDDSPGAAGEETPGPLSLTVAGKEIPEGAIAEEGNIYLPLIETGKALGWDVTEESRDEDDKTRRSVVMEKDGSRITVSWTVSDNTAKQITWQKDGLLIPVDTEITSIDGVTCVPAAFFETAMRVTVEDSRGAVAVHTPEPQATPENSAQAAGGEDEKESTENN